MQNAKCKMQNARCKMQKCKMQNAKCKMQNAKCKMQNAKMQNAIIMGKNVVKIIQCRQSLLQYQMAVIKEVKV